MYKTKTFYELANACFLIFGPLFHFSDTTIRYLNPSDIKSAYREKAKIFHPDSSNLKNKSKEELSILFNELNEAYNLLLKYIKVKAKFNEKISNKFKLIKSFNNNYYKIKKDFFYTGQMPKRKLRIGEYLYYSKKISWKTLINAIITQYKTRPKIGDLCLKLNFLNINEINKVIKNINIHEKFGEAAKRLGFLNDYQVLVALGFQKRYNRPFGLYFIENNIFTINKLELYKQECKKYNSNYNKLYTEIKN